MLIAMLVFVMAGCFFGEMSYVKSPASGVITGMFVPKLAGQGATDDAIALLGAFVMPVGALQNPLNVLTIKPLEYIVYIVIIRMPVDISSWRATLPCWWFFFINVAVVLVLEAVCSADNLSRDDHHRCNDLNLNFALFLL
ncbi:metal transporter Nramp5 [Gossypium hirsutum]|nr:metal transporter Nramp5-like [Gossypium hirsutum]